jgi:chromosome segregation ATPase
MMSKDERESARGPLFVAVSERAMPAEQDPMIGWKHISPAGQHLHAIPVEQELVIAQRELQDAKGRLQAAKGERQAAERDLATAERKLRAVREGGNRGRRKGHEAKREHLEELREAVTEHREKHPKHGRPEIAKALLGRFSRQPDHADPKGKARAIRALTKKIERLEKSLDT